MRAYEVSHWLCVSYLFAGYYSVNTIVMSAVPSNVAAHATATSAPDPTVWFQRSAGPVPAIVRAPPPIYNFSTLFPVPPIDLDLTSASMFNKIQSPKFLQIPLATLGYKIQTNLVGTPVGNPCNKSRTLDK